MAGTITATTDAPIRDVERRIVGRKIILSCTADGSDGSFPNFTLKRLPAGYLQPIITNPGSTAPTDNYDIALYHSDDSTADIADSNFANRDTANTEIKAATISGSASPIFLNGGNYTLAISNNSVNSATIQIIMEIVALTA